MKSKITIFVIVSLLDLIQIGKAKDGVIRFSSNIIHENKLYPEQAGQSYTNYQFDPTNFLGNEQTYSNYDEPKLFNVGYTITFSNNPNNQQLNNGRIGDVIVGTRSSNEVPIRPNPTSQSSPTSPTEEIILNEFLDGKKRKLSGIKPKYYRPLTHGLNTKHLLAQANLSPKTQMKLAELQIPETQAVMKENPISSSQWKPLSSGVEIYHSNNVYPSTNQNYLLNPGILDHAEALKNSINFDRSNVISPNHYQRYGRNYNS